jgi:hypothetical protein
MQYNFKLFTQHGQPEHGVFLLELLSQFKQTGFQHSFLHGKYESLLGPVLNLCTTHPTLKKRVICTLLIHIMMDFNQNMQAPDEKYRHQADVIIREICAIITIHKEQQLIAAEENHPIFYQAGSLYFNLIADH